jgi:hypothetical protein
LPRDDIKRLGNIFADLGELGAAATGTACRHRMNNAPTRQIGGKVAPRRRPPREASHLHARRIGLRFVLSGCRGQFLELQFQLIDEPLAADGATGSFCFF